MASLYEQIKAIFNPKPEADKKEEMVVTKPPSGDAVVDSIAISDKTILQGIDVDTAAEGKLISLYHKMENDSIIAAALDLYADNATQVNDRTGHVAAVVCSDKKREDEFNDFLWNVVHVDTEAWQWIRDLARDGKVFLDTRTDGSDWSFIPVQDPSQVNALTRGQNIVEYFVVAPEDKKESWENQHLSVIYSKDEKNLEEYSVEDSDRYIYGFNTREIVGKMEIQTDTKYKDKKQVEELLIQTGRSALANVVSTYQTLSALEDAIFINRLTKSTEFKIVQVDVSDSNNKQSRQILDAVKNAFKSSETIDQTAERYHNRQSPIPINDFIYVPTKGGKGSITMDTVGGEVGEQKLADIEYYRNKLFAGLGVLKAYLGFEETTPGGLGDTTLTMLDERFGRKVKRMQQVLKGILEQLLSYYWRYSSVDRNPDNMPDYELVLGKVSTKEDEAKQQRLDKSIDTATKVVNMARDELFIDKIDTDKLFNFVFNDIIGMDTSNFDNKPSEENISVKIKDMEEKIKSLEKDKKSKKARTSLTESVKSSKKEFRELIDDYDIYVETKQGDVFSISEAVASKRYKKGIISEKTLGQLKGDSKSQDPARLPKSKKLTVKYTGLDKNNLINFTVSAEDPADNAAKGRPTSYRTKVSLKDLAYLIKATIEDEEQLTESDLVNLAMQGDLGVACNCAAAKYWGQQYLGTRQDYSLDKNDIPPKRNVPTQPVCKHTLATLTVLPFWYNTLVRDLRSSGLLPSAMTDDQKQQVKNSDVE